MDQDMSSEIKNGMEQIAKEAVKPSPLRLTPVLFGIVFIVYIMGTYHVGIIWTLLILFIVWWRARRYYDKIDHYKEVDLEKAFLESRQANQLLKQINMKLPVWITFPDIERGRWFNSILTNLWPHLNQALESTVIPIIEEAAKPFLPVFLKSLKVITFDIGTKPIFFTGFKTLPTPKNITLIDLYFKWASNLVISIRAVSAISFLSVTAYVKDLCINGRLRIQLSHLKDLFPLIGQIDIGFGEKPTLSFDLSMGEHLDVLNIPGLETWLNGFIHQLLEDILLWPNTIPIELIPSNINDNLLLLGEDGDVKDMESEPAGILHVFLYEGTNMINKDLLDKSDCFCVLIIEDEKTSKKTKEAAVEAEKNHDAFDTLLSPLTKLLPIGDNHDITESKLCKRSEIIINSLNPIWNESFEFLLDTPPNESKQLLHIFVFDDDKLGKSEPLGDICISLDELQHDIPIEGWYNLEHVKHGKLHFDICWKVFPHYLEKEKKINEMKKNIKISKKNNNINTTTNVKINNNNNELIYTEPPPITRIKSYDEFSSDISSDNKKNVSTTSDTPVISSSGSNIINTNNSSIITTPSEKKISNNENKSSDKPFDVAQSRNVDAMLEVVVEKATNLIKKDILSSDPYVKITLGDQEYQTEVIRKTLNPIWNQTFYFTVTNSFSEILKVEVFDKDSFKDDPLGSIDIELREVVNNGNKLENRWDLKNVKKGKIFLTLSLKPVDSH